MTSTARLTRDTLVQALDPALPVLIAGPTASGKSALALRIVAAQGGVIVNADASQVYGCWRVLTARPSTEEEARAPHRLFGHVRADQSYSAGHWLREVAPLLGGPERPVIVGGTGLYFNALTRGLADIPATPPDIRARADRMALPQMLAELDSDTRARIDTRNPARVQRAWEVLTATGRGLALWQEETGQPLLPLARAQAIVVDAPKDWLNDRIERRFGQMIADGALDEVRAVLPGYDAKLPAHRAIGVPELVAHLRGEISLDAARAAAVVATRQFAKRQRTWFRSQMRDWHRFNPLV
jgi:tRNA dimethylallyltransferase